MAMAQDAAAGGATASAAQAAPGACALCGPDDDRAVHLVARSLHWRVVRVLNNPDHPAFWRVIWNPHAAEISDLEGTERHALMQAVFTVEQAVRRELQPLKINLASLGNMVPHVHWHVIARFATDRHFPQPVWAPPQREADERLLVRLSAQVPQVDRAIQQALLRR